MRKETPVRVLVGEDELNWSRLIKHILEKDEGTKVVLTPNITETLRMLDGGELFTHAFIDAGLSIGFVPASDVALMRWEKPNVRNVCERLQEQGAKVILITGQKSAEVSEISSSLGVNVLFKGYDDDINDKIRDSIA